MIVIPCGTAKSLYFFGSVERLIVVLPGTAGAFAASTALSMSACAWARLWTGPRRGASCRRRVERGRRPCLRAGLLAGEQVEHARARDRLALRADRRPGQVRLEVEELELRGLADQLRSLLRVVHAGELDDDLVGALLADLGLGDAELVDPVPHDRDRAVEVGGRDLVALRRHRLEHDLEAALQVETERATSCATGEPGTISSADADERRRGSGRAGSDSYCAGARAPISLALGFLDWFRRLGSPLLGSSGGSTAAIARFDEPGLGRRARARR